MMTWLADVLRDAGLIVEEVAGWQDRGHGDADPQVIVNHHTAGGPNGRLPSFGTCLYGVPGVPGPLCNVMQSRESDGPDHFVIIAAGNSYNAGTGGWAGYSGNWRTVGLEVEHTGIEYYPDDRREWTRRFNAAVLNHLGLDSSRSCQHYEWSSAGKIDIAQGVDGDQWRATINDYQHGAGGFWMALSDDEQRELLDHVRNMAKEGIPEFGVKNVFDSLAAMTQHGVDEFGLPNLFAGQHEIMERLNGLGKRLDAIDGGGVG